MAFPVLFPTRRAAAGITEASITLNEVGDVNSTTIEVTFSLNVNSPTADYVSGITIKVNAVSATISSGTRQGDHHIVHYVLASKVDIDDAFTVEYDSAVGDLEDEDTSTPFGDIAATAGTNYVGSHWYFDEEWDSFWAAVEL